MHSRYVSRGCGTIWVLLPLLIAGFWGVSRAQDPEDRLLSAARGLSEVPPASVDFDGDRVVDLLTLDHTQGHLRLEIHLGRTHEVSFLPVDTLLAVAGSLTIRDLDNDGDSDLFWKGKKSLAPPDIIIWLNDGTGHFARLLSLHSRPAVPLPGRSFRKDTFPMAPHYEVLPSKRVFSPLSLLTFDRIWQRSTRGQHVPWTVMPFLAFFTWYPSDRGPPSLF